jgi:hypothetical protein
VNDNVTGPAGVALDVESVMVAGVLTVAVAGDGETDTPEGRPVTEMLTDALNPRTGVMDTVTEVGAPCQRPIVEGDTAIVKSGVGVSPTDAVVEPESPPPQLASPKRQESARTARSKPIVRLGPRDRVLTRFSMYVCLWREWGRLPSILSGSVSRGVRRHGFSTTTLRFIASDFIPPEEVASNQIASG